MDFDLLRVFIDLIAVSQGQIPFELRNYGQVIQILKGPGFIGGKLSQIITGSCGQMRLEQINVSSILGCGHLINNLTQIKGYCKICGSFCFTNPGCLEVCMLSGKTVCRKHYKIERGIIVGASEQGMFWKMKARRLRKRLDDYSIERRLIEHKDE